MNHFEKIFRIIKNWKLIILSSLNLGWGGDLQDRSWSIELDPIAYALKGYSVHGLVEQGSWRADLGVFGLEMPSSSLNTSQSQDPQKVRMDGWGLKFDYIMKSWFVGLQSNAARFTQRVNSTESTSRKSSESIWRYDLSGRFGYRGLITENFYWSPWISWGPTWGKEKFKSGTSIINYPFATVHLGWLF